ncbi:MAG TPA: lamin tail domain-containing protein [Vulgatibacter sp.]|nr:lamin tail domain-containing protein [Vulgatibacter sp.]
MRTAFANSITATETQLLPGQETTIGWSTAGTDQVTVTDGPLAPPVEVTESRQFIDLEMRPTATELTPLVPTSPTSSERTGSVPLQLPFDFPYFGELHGELRVIVSGYLSFDPNHVTGTTAADFPSPTKKEAHIAPFMSQLTLKPSGATDRIGKIFWEHIDTGVEDFVVIQWSHMQYSSSSRNPSDLNFQVVLSRDGSFDIRYGPNTGAAASTDGTYASIGYQDPTGTQGYSFSARTAFPGGLVSRSFHFAPHSPASGSMTVAPDESKTYSVCVTGAGGYSECKSTRVVVLQPGDVSITEVMPDPVGGDDARWFEIRNLTADTLDLGGLVVESAGGVPFTAGALTLPPGGYATFAETSAVQGFTPSVITGPDVAVGSAGALTLKMPYPAPAGPGDPAPAPLTLAELAWNATFPYQPGQSMYLDPSFHYRGTTANNDATRWCPGDAGYDGSNLGSPGAHGGSCKSQHYVVDWHSTLPFIDIEPTGLLLNQIAANDGVGQMPGGLGFTMPFFGGAVSDLWASASGFVSFGPLASDFPTARSLGGGGDPADGLVAAQWENFEMPARLNAKFLFERRTVGAKQVTILQWTRFQRRLKPDNATFQVQLWSDGDIVIANREFVALAGKGGASATIGIEAPLGTDAITYLRNQALLDPGQVLHFRKK